MLSLLLMNCVIQDRISRKLIRVGESKNGLIFKPLALSSFCAFSAKSFMACLFGVSFRYCHGKIVRME